MTAIFVRLLRNLTQTIWLKLGLYIHLSIFYFFTQDLLTNLNCIKLPMQYYSSGGTTCFNLGNWSQWQATTIKQKIIFHSLNFFHLQRQWPWLLSDISALSKKITPINITAQSRRQKISHFLLILARKQ